MKIVLDGKPQSTNHVYKRHGNIIYMTTEGKQLKYSYSLQAKQQYKGKVLEGDISVDIKLYFSDKRRRDIDNFHKLTMDSLTGIVWKDDSQIVKMTVEKLIDKHSRIEIIIL